MDFEPKLKNTTDYYACYRLGCFDETKDITSLSPTYYRKQNLQEVASSILGLKHEIIQPILATSIKDRPIQEKYICISTESTAGFKEWQNQGGWQEVVNFLKEMGYRVVVIQRQETKLKNIIYPDQSLDSVICLLNYSDFFIGLSSGISWLAHSLNKPVISIGGAIDVGVEFPTKYRVINKSVCNSCWGKSWHDFDKNNWDWCPEHENTVRHFECSKQISFNMVKEKIQQLVNDINKSK